MKKVWLQNIGGTVMALALLLATSSAVQAQIFTAVEDAYVAQASPDFNSGTLTRLHVRSGASGSEKTAYIKFVVSGLQGNVRLARLKLKSKSADVPVSVYAVADNSWTETGLTWNNRPAPGALLDTVTAYPGEWITFDVTDAVAGDGTYTFAVTSSLDAKRDFSSRQGSGAPVLDISTDHELDWQVVETVYPTEDIVMAAVVMDAGRLPADPENEDCSPSIQTALDEVGAAGGGTVFLPAGIYRCDSSIKFPTDVYLRGDIGPLSDSDKSVRGTLLKVTYDGLDTNDDPPFIELENRTGVQHLSIWYPDQDVSAVIPYAATLAPRKTHWLIKEIAVRNVNLVNSYRGLILDTKALRSNIRGVYGSPLNLGLHQQSSSSIPGYSLLNFSSDYWAQSGLPNAPAQADLMAYMKAHATGIQIAASDNICATDWHAADCLVGLNFLRDPGEGTMNGMVYGWSTTNCTTGILAEPIGATRFINCHFAGDTAAVFNKDCMDLYFNGCSFHSSVSEYAATLARNTGNNYAQFQYCRFNNKVKVDKLYTSFVDCTFDYTGGAPIELSSATPSAVVAGNTFAYGGDPIQRNGADASKVLFDPNPTYSEPFLPFDVENGYDRIRKPAGTNLIVMGDPGYEATVDGTTDDAPVLQRALDDVAALGGGIVMVPQWSDAGYAIRTPLTVPAGVELRTSPEGKHSYIADENMPGALLQIYHGLGGTEPAITLGEGSGFKGFTIYYPELISSNRYAAAIGVVGNDAYVQNVQSVNATHFIECIGSTNVLLDCMLVETLVNPFRFKNCADCRVRDIHIRSEWNTSGLPGRPEYTGRPLRDLITFEIIDSTDIEIVSTFSRSALWAARFENSTVHGLQFKGEACNNGIYVNGIPAGGRIELLGSSYRMNRDLDTTVTCLDLNGMPGDGDFRMIASMLDGYPDTFLEVTDLDCTLQQTAISMDVVKVPDQGFLLNGEGPGVTRIENCKMDFPFLTTEIADVAGKRLELVANTCLAGVEYPLNAEQYSASVDPSAMTVFTRFAAAANLVAPKLGAPLNVAPVDGGLLLTTTEYETESVNYSDLGQTKIGYRPANAAGELVFEVTRTLFDEGQEPNTKSIQFGYYEKEAGTISVEYQVPGGDWKVAGTLALSDETSDTTLERTFFQVNESPMLEEGARIRLVQESGDALIAYVVFGGTELLSIPFGTLPNAAAPEPIQHLNATVAASVGGNPVSLWEDQSGVGNHASNAVGSIYYPSVSRSDSGLAGLNFGTNRNALTLFSAPASDAWLNQSNGLGFCVLVAFKADALEPSWSDLLGNSSGTAEGFGLRYNNSGTLQAYLGGVSINKSAVPIAADDTVVYAFNYDPVAGQYEFWDSLNNNAVTQTVAAADFSRSIPVTLGYMNKSTRYIQGMVGEVKIYDRRLPAADFQSEREALAAKWITNGIDTLWGPWGVDVGSETADLDGDGLINLYEYGLNGDPMDPLDTGTAPILTVEGGSAQFIHLRRNDDSNLVYQVETSTNLVSGVWTNAGYTVQGTNAMGGGTFYDEITNGIPVDAKEKYIRLKITAP